MIRNTARLVLAGCAAAISLTRRHRRRRHRQHRHPRARSAPAAAPRSSRASRTPATRCARPTTRSPRRRRPRSTRTATARSTQRTRSWKAKRHQAIAKRHCLAKEGPEEVPVPAGRGAAVAVAAAAAAVAAAVAAAAETTRSSRRATPVCRRRSATPSRRCRSRPRRRQPDPGALRRRPAAADLRRRRQTRRDWRREPDPGALRRRASRRPSATRRTAARCRPTRDDPRSDLRARPAAADLRPHRRPAGATAGGLTGRAGVSRGRAECVTRYRAAPRLRSLLTPGPVAALEDESTLHVRREPAGRRRAQRRRRPSSTPSPRASPIVAGRRGSLSTAGRPPGGSQDVLRAVATNASAASAARRAQPMDLRCLVGPDATPSRCVSGDSVRPDDQRRQHARQCCHDEGAHGPGTDPTVDRHGSARAVATVTTQRIPTTPPPWSPATRSARLRRCGPWRPATPPGRSRRCGRAPR